MIAQIFDRKEAIALSFSIAECWCFYQKNPLGIDVRPQFSWRMESSLSGDRQTAYRLLVSSSPDLSEKTDKILWDSGKIYTEENIQIPYSGLPLSPHTKYWWRVTVWNSENEEASSVQFFETGKMKEPWYANWIGAPYITREEESYTAPYLRKKITLSGKPEKARLYICGLGYYEAYIEGSKIADSMLEPAFTRYDKTVLYQTYDVTAMLSKEFALGVLLGNGWYNCFAQDPWNTRQASWKHWPKLIAEFHIVYEDGREEVIPTDPTWQSAKSPIVFNGIRNGEFYDARLEKEDWCRFSSSDEGWQPAVILRPAGGELTAENIEPVRITQKIPTVRQWRTEEGNWLFDLGQNFAGIVQLKAPGPTGTTITLRYAEELTEDRLHVDQSHIKHFIKSGEFQTDRYTKKSDEMEEWSPRFVYHGFRYVEISGLPEKIPDDCVTGLVMHTDFARRGYFSCSDERINRIQEMCHWSTVSNFFGIPTDCPHREKNAWTGDAGISVEQILMNFQSVRAFLKWLDDIVDSQRPNGMIPCVVPSTGWGYHWGNGPDWSNGLVASVWYCYLYTGDKEILRKYFPALQKHFSCMLSMSQDYIVDYGIGDWCAPFVGPAVSENMSSFKAPVSLTDTSFFYNTAEILEKICVLLGWDSSYYREMRIKIKASIYHRFIGENGEVAGNCQTSDACILFQGLAEGQTEEKILHHLVNCIKENNWHIDFGILGCKFVPHVLGDHGAVDVFYKMLSQPDFPGFQHWLDMGATTLFECWNGLGSHNHHMFSNVSAAFYQYIGGIKVDEKYPGFRRFRIQPGLFRELEWVRCSHECLHGVISVIWKKSGTKIEMTITVPFGTQAELVLPASVEDEKIPKILESGVHKLELSMAE